MNEDYKDILSIVLNIKDNYSKNIFQQFLIDEQVERSFSKFFQFVIYRITKHSYSDELLKPGMSLRELHETALKIYNSESLKSKEFGEFYGKLKAAR